VAEGVYDATKPAGEQRGVDRLLASFDAAGIGVRRNVWGHRLHLIRLTPHGQIDAFRTFAISDEFQERSRCCYALQ